MTKLAIIFLYLTVIILCGCNNQAIENKKTTAEIASTIQDNVRFKSLHGTWIRQNKYSCTFIEIKDTSNILYYQFINTHSESGTTANDGYWYYKSKAKMGYWDTNTVWITTDKFRFDYKLHGDTLLEFDKMGIQGKFIKVYTDEQKAYNNFYAANLKAEIIHINKAAPSEYFILNNIDNEFSFISIPNNNTDNKQLTDIASVGDSIIKPQFSDTLTLKKKQTNKSYNFGFVENRN